MKNTELGKILKQLIASNKMKEAIDVLLNYVKNNEDIRKSLVNDIILLSSRLNSIERSSNRGIITNSEVNIEKNRITKSILDLIEELDEAVPITERQIQIEA